MKRRISISSILMSLLLILLIPSCSNNTNISTSNNITSTTIQSSSVSIEVLQILDSLRIIKHIPGSTVDEALSAIIIKIESLSPKLRKELISSAKEYNPSVRALIGAIISSRFASLNVSFLKNSLNSLSVYKIGVSQNILPDKKDWKIK